MTLLAGNTITDSAQIALDQQNANKQREIDSEQEAYDKEQAALNRQLALQELEVRRQNYARNADIEQAKLGVMLQNAQTDKEEKEIRTILDRVTDIDKILTSSDNIGMDQQTKERLLAERQAMLTRANQISGIIGAESEPIRVSLDDL
jgi:DNA helicase IV